MIRYDCDFDQLRALVDEYKPRWRVRAKQRTDKFRELGVYSESSSIWGEIKAVYMRIQVAKCCFCERKFEGGFSQYELDLEHFRPKRSVKEWPCPPGLAAIKGSPTSPPVENNGYYLLSYHILNYAVACKPCNSGLKKSYFPISGNYDFLGSEPIGMHAEAPWLVYPIGNSDIDPEEVISFYGLFPQCESDSPYLRLRGLATISFFGLDDVIGRKNLMRERAQVIFVLHAMLERAKDEGHAAAADHVSKMVASSAVHANFARSFRRLFDQDRIEAEKVADDVEQFILSIS